MDIHRQIVVGLIIPSWNGLKYLAPCLESLFQQTFRDFEILVVDNGSTDGSVAYIQEKFPDIRLIVFDKNYGFSKAVNAGIKHFLGNSSIRYIASVNNDMEFDSRWLEELVKAADLERAAGFFASKVMQYDTRDTVNSAGDIYCDTGFATHRGFREKDSGQFGVRERVFGASGCAAVYRCRMLQDIGFFDEDFFAYCEDVDLSFRAQLKGYECIYVPEAVAYHREWSTGKDFADYYCTRNTIFVLTKNMPFGLLLKYSPSIFFGQIAYFLRMRGNSKAILAGWFSAFLNIVVMLKKRKIIQSSRRISNKKIDSLISSSKVPKKSSIK